MNLEFNPTLQIQIFVPKNEPEWNYDILIKFYCSSFVNYFTLICFFLQLNEALSDLITFYSDHHIVSIRIVWVNSRQVKLFSLANHNLILFIEVIYEAWKLLPCG